VQDAAGAVAATGTIAFTSAPTANGTISLYVAGQLVTVPVTAGQTTAQIATAVAAAPAAETFKKSRRFIKSSPCRGVFPYGLKRALRHANKRIQPRPLAAGLSTDAGVAKRDNGMTALNKSRR